MGVLGGHSHQESRLLSFLTCLLVCSPDYIALVRKTQTLDKEALQALSKQYDAIYFHPVRASIHTPSPRLISICLGVFTPTPDLLLSFYSLL